MCIIADTAKRLGCSNEQVFRQVSENMGGVLHADFLATGKVPMFVESFCLDILIKPNRKATNLLGGVGSTHHPIMGLSAEDLETDAMQA